VTRTMLK